MERDSIRGLIMLTLSMERDYSTDRIRGLAISALSDALGAPREFEYNKKRLAYSKELTQEIRFLSRWQPERYSAVSACTDDTELARALLNSLYLNNCCYVQQHVLSCYLEWAASKPAGMGINTRKLLYGLKHDSRRMMADFKRRQEKVFAGSVSESNGSLMRCWPLALLKNHEEAAELDCNMTNPTASNWMAELAYLAALKAALSGADSKQTVINAALNAAALNDKVTATLHAAILDKKPVLVGPKGWVLTCLYVCFYCFVHTDSYTEAMRVINEVIDGDTDTDGHVTGALLGAFYGWKQLMRDETTRRNWEMLTTCDTASGDFPRPDKYHPKTLLPLLDALCLGRKRKADSSDSLWSLLTQPAAIDDSVPALLPKPDGTRVVAVGGASRSGKTTLCKAFQKRATVIRMDAFFTAKKPKCADGHTPNWEVPEALNKRLLYTTVNRALKKAPAVIIIEGFLVFAFPELQPLFDHRLLLKITKNECWKRRSTSTKPVSADYFNTVLWPSYLKYNREALRSSSVVKAYPDTARDVITALL